MDEDGVEPIKPSLETCAIDGQLAIIVSMLTSPPVIHTAYAHLSRLALTLPRQL